MRRNWLIGIIVLVLPLCLFGKIIYVAQDVSDVSTAVAIAEDGDTIMLPTDQSYQSIDTMGKDLTIGYYETSATEPEGATPDSTIYGTNEPFPASPVE